MRRYLIYNIVFLVSLTAFGQYWFGPKVGLNYIDHVYQESGYESDTSFNVPKNFNFQAGAAVSYSATGPYSVYGELLYERIGKKVTDAQTDGEMVRSNMVNHFISAPIMLRVTLGSLPFHYYVNGGPRLSYWLGGNGDILIPGSDEFLEEEFLDENGDPLPLEYSVTFNDAKAQETDFSNKKAFVSKPNRLQFGLTAGAGIILDVLGADRVQLDFRYTWVHSNMALNTEEDDTFFNGEDYRENFEYYHNIATVSVAYLFGYNSDLRRKGKSTSKKSNDKKK